MLNNRSYLLCLSCRECYQFCNKLFADYSAYTIAAVFLNDDKTLPPMGCPVLNSNKKCWKDYFLDNPLLPIVQLHFH